MKSAQSDENETKQDGDIEKIKEGREIFEDLFNAVNSGVAIYEVINDGESGKDYIIKDFNKKSLELEGKTKAEVVGKSLYDLRPNIDDYGLIPEFRKVWKTGESRMYPIKEYVDDNFSNYYENRIFRLPNKNIVAVYDDVTERKLAEEKIRKSEERFNLAMEATSDGLYDWDLINNTIYYSPAWKKMLGYSDKELENDFSVWEKLTHPDDVKKAWELLEKLKSKKIDRFEMEFKMKHKDGSWVDILSRAKAIFDKDGKAYKIVGTHVDITEKKVAESKLKAKIDELERFQKLTVDRETRMVELKNEIKKLKGEDSK